MEVETSLTTETFNDGGQCGTGRVNSWTHETFILSVSIARNRVETMNRTRGRQRHDKGSKCTHKWNEPDEDTDED